jgi:hypothetical protein
VFALVGCWRGGSTSRQEAPVIAAHDEPAPPSRVWRVDDHTLTIYLPNDFPDPTLDLTTAPDPTVHKEFWTAIGPRGMLFIVVWRLPASVRLDVATVTQVFDAWRTEQLEQNHVALQWEHAAPVPGRLAREFRTRPTGEVPAMQLRYMLIGDRILDLRVIATSPETLDAADIVAFFTRSGPAPSAPNQHR